MKYKRILLKLSGESLQGKSKHGIDPDMLSYYAGQVSELIDSGIELAIVIGGGNIFRGLGGSASGVDRVKGDQMGMLATVINSLALESGLRAAGIRARVYTAIRMEPVGTLYQKDKVVNMMTEGTVCILAGGTGNPFFTTDTAAALRAVETDCDILLKGTRVDGVYSGDPEKDKDAVRYESISFDEAIDKELRIMDRTAFTMCRENNMPVVVFNINEKGELLKIAKGEGTGTLVYGS